MNKPKSFHNTIGIQGEFLFDANERAESQQDKILRFFRNHPRQGFTPFDVHAALFDEKTPVTSVRRAMSNLSHPKVGLLIKTDKKVIQRFGQVNCKWFLNQNKTTDC